MYRASTEGRNTQSVGLVIDRSDTAPETRSAKLIPNTFQNVRATPAISSSRNPVIDIARGLLILLMSNTHALTLTGINDKHFFYSDLWLPNGWATITFILLSGFSVAFLEGNGKADSMSQRRLYRRALNLIMIMICTNLLFSTMRYVLSGQSAGTALGGATADFFAPEEWTISAILLPTAIMLCVASYFIDKIRTHALLAFAGVLSAQFLCRILTEGSRSGEYSALFDLMFISGLGGFPIVPLLLNGLLGLTLGIVFSTDPALFKRLLCYGLLIQFTLFVASSEFMMSSSNPLIAAVHRSIGSLGFFSCIYLGAMALSKKMDSKAQGFFLTIGKYALMAFILHRVLLQGLSFTFDRLGIGAMGLEAAYALLLTSTMLGVWGVCVARDRFKFVDLKFRKLAM